jgi:hypothetical protein
VLVLFNFNPENELRVIPLFLMHQQEQRNLHRGTAQASPFSKAWLLSSYIENKLQRTRLHHFF